MLRATECPSFCLSVCLSVQNRKAFIFNFVTQNLGGPAKQEGFHLYFFHTQIRGTYLSIASEPVGAGSVVVVFPVQHIFRGPLKGTNSS